MFAKIRQIRSHRMTYVILAALELAAAYACASLAINNGNLWWYLAAFILLLGSLQNLAELTVSFKKKSSRGPRR